MIDVKNFIKEPKSVRQLHLCLDEKCVERGGNSTNHKGILAQYLDSTIPSGRILLCHACNNDKCSNPKHLYWGTDKENITQDNLNWKSVWAKMIEKYGYEEACKRQSRGDKAANGGKANKGKPKSEEHKKNIAEAIKRKYKN